MKILATMTHSLKQLDNCNKWYCKDIATIGDPRKKILFVDDEPDMTLLFKQMMETGGFSVDVFNDSAGALRNFKPHFYDLVMLDLVMPKMDGFDLYKELKKQDPDVNVCFITASGQHH